jgi:hypothetical protein
MVKSGGEVSAKGELDALFALLGPPKHDIERYDCINLCIWPDS